MSVDPQKVLIVSPTHDGNFCAGYVTGIVSSVGLYAAASAIVGMSSVALARNLQAHTFLNLTQFDWLVSIDADTEFSRRDFSLLMEGDEQIVVAEYSKKTFADLKPNQFGMGFARIHRSVFENMFELHHEGQKIVNTFDWHGSLVDDYFQEGAKPGKWIGEDHGFFALARMTNPTIRVETRTRLIHWGRYGFAYTPPSSSSVAPSVPD